MNNFFVNNIDIIVAKQYFLELNAARAKRKLELEKLYENRLGDGDQYKYFELHAEIFNVLQNIIINKRNITNPKTFVNICNPLLKEREFWNYEFEEAHHVPSLGIRKENNKTLIHIEDRLYTPLVWQLENSLTEYAFFRTDESKEQVEGIYLCNTPLKEGKPYSKMRRLNFIMTPMCYKKLILPIDKYLFE